MLKRVDVTNDIVDPATAAMIANPAGAAAIASIVQTPVPFAGRPPGILSDRSQSALCAIRF